SAKSITGAISKQISAAGLLGVYEALDEDGRRRFKQADCVCYGPAADILTEIYDEVESGNEIRSVVSAAHRLTRFPMSEIAGTEMWQVGPSLRRKRPSQIDAGTAG